MKKVFKIIVGAIVIVGAVAYAIIKCNRKKNIGGTI